MKDLTQTAIIGIDVSRDWLDTCLVPSERQRRIPNTPDGHRAVLKLAQDHAAIVCFESTGGLEWKLWQALAEAGVAARQVPPAQGEPLMRLPVICATGPSNHWRRFKHNGERLRQKLWNLGQDRPGRCHAHRPFFGLPTRRRARDSIARDSGSWQGKRTIGDGRRTLRHVIFQAALVARHHNPALKAFADRLKAAGKPASKNTVAKHLGRNAKSRMTEQGIPHFEIKPMT